MDPYVFAVVTMYVLHVNAYYSPFGGAEITTLKQMRLAESAGFRVGIVYFRGEEYSDPEAKGRVRFVRMIDPERPSGVVFDELADIVQKERPDLIHYHNLWPVPNLIFDQRLPTLAPSVLHEHGHRLTCIGGNRVHYRPFRPCPVKPGLNCFILSLLTKCCPRRHPIRLLRKLKAMRTLPRLWRKWLIVTPSGFIRDELVKSGFDRERVHVLPNYVEIPREWHLPMGNRILYAGRIERVKGITDLIEAVVGLSCTLRIFGSGSYEGEVKAAIARRALDDSVEFCGPVSAARLAEEHQAARLVVIPSVCYESFCNVGTEAMSHGRPVVAYDAGGIREWLTDSVTGYIVPLGNKRLLRARIREVLADQGLSNRMAHAARKACEERFCHKLYEERLFRLYSLAMKGQKS